MTTTDSRPIGVFDSGAGGLTVLKELCRHFPKESFIYLGDTARLPYGSKSSDTILKYSQQIISRLQDMNVKAIVIACNSASTVLKHKTHFNNIPIYNVIQPGAQTAITQSEGLRIGVVGTYATINSQAYTKEILTLCPQAKIFSQACPLWVPLAEEGWKEDPITNLIAYRYLQPLIAKNIDTLILGCTHYSILKSAIERVTTSKVRLIDSGTAICQWLKKDFANNELKINNETSPKTQIFLTDVNPQFCQLAEYLLGSNTFEQISHIDL